MMKIKVLFILGSLLLSILIFGTLVAAAAGEAESGANKGLIAVGMGLAVGLGALGTGVAQARIGAAGLGSAVEKPESLGLALIFFLLPETLVIFGLVIAFILLGKL
jgi:V/A-type H+-transporting ATPase subunit K